MKLPPRALVVIIFFALAASLTGWRLYDLQIAHGAFYRALANGQQTQFNDATGQRGKVFATDDGELTVMSTVKDQFYCFAVPKEMENEEAAVEKLSSILSYKKEDVFPKLKNKESQFCEIKDKLSKEEVKALQEANIKGVYVRKKYISFYPHGKVASNILGYVDREGKGLYGVQGYYNEQLSPTQGLAASVKGLQEYLDNSNSGIQNGADVVLTIDVNIQKKAQELLEEAYKKFNIESGQIIVMDPYTGRIVALANYPDYDPNDYSKYADNMAVFQNWAVQKLYEPGSVFKAITMAIGLETESISPTTTYNDPCKEKFDRFLIGNYDGRCWGRRNMTEVLERSINTGMIFVERQIGHKKYYQYLVNFGMFKKTGVDMAGEAVSANENLKSMRDVNFATCSFGQGISITPLRLAVSYSALANGGNIMRPYIVEKIIKPDGTIKETKPEIEYPGIISQETSLAIRKMLNSVTEDGYSQYARVPGYFVGGKTGTAQQPGPGGYSKKTWHTFAGIAPIYSPKYVIIVKLDNPAAPEASASAAPIFSKLGEYALNYAHVPTERPMELPKYKTVK
jgi:cell division protein FtsI/penicillin-binding protein 2